MSKEATKVTDHPTWKFVNFYKKEMKTLLDAAYADNLDFLPEVLALERAHAETCQLQLVVEDKLIAEGF